MRGRCFTALRKPRGATSFTQRTVSQDFPHTLPHDHAPTRDSTNERIQNAVRHKRCHAKYARTNRQEVNIKRAHAWIKKKSQTVHKINPLFQKKKEHSPTCAGSGSDWTKVSSAMFPLLSPESRGLESPPLVKRSALALSGEHGG